MHTIFVQRIYDSIMHIDSGNIQGDPKFHLEINWYIHRGRQQRNVRNYNRAYDRKPSV